MDVKKALGEFSPRVTTLIEEILRTEEAYAQRYSPLFQELFHHLQELSAGGKRLRAALTYYSYMMHGGNKENKDIMLLAAVVELNHTYILIQDDVMDQDEKRRGVKNLHKTYADLHLQNHWHSVDPHHFGESIALCGSLVLSHLTQHILAKSSIPGPVLKNVLGSFHRNLVDTGYGQVLDVMAEVLPEVTEDQVEQILLLKTARYTYQNPMEVGALLAGADADQVSKLASYAVPAGIAFQIQDDILGMFGDETKTGKPAGSDLQEGKRNLLTVKTLQLAKPDARKRFAELLGKPQLTPEMLSEARTIITESGSLEYSRKRAKALVDEALQVIKDTSVWQGEGRDFLEAIAIYMINRDV